MIMTRPQPYGYVDEESVVVSARSTWSGTAMVIEPTMNDTPRMRYYGLEFYHWARVPWGFHVGTLHAQMDSGTTPIHVFVGDQVCGYSWRYVCSGNKRVKHN
jgi:hypothetical protein